MHRQIAGKLTGPVTKWFVLAVWLVLGIGSSVLGCEAHRRAGQPGLVLAARQRRVHQGPRQARGLPEPERHPDHRGLRAHRRAHPADLAAAKADAQEFADIDGVTGKVIGPIPSQDGQAAQTLVTLRLRQGRVEQDARRRRRAAQDRRPVGRHASTSPARAVRPPTRSEAFGGIDGILLVSTLAGGDPDPAGHLPQSGPVDPADLLRRDRAVHRAGRGLPARQVRRPDRQRAEPGHPDGARDRRRHRLRTAAGRALPGRAPPPRGPARGDGVRAAPCQPGDLRQWHDRGPRHAVPAAWPR